MSHASDRDRVWFAYQRIRAPLVVGGEVGVLQVVVGEALVASGVASCSKLARGK